MKLRSRFVVLEGAGRDEVVVDQADQLQPLSRQQTQRRLLDSILGSGLTQAFLVRGDAEAPRLTYQTRRRVTVETAGARIGKAETIVAMDDYGAFRGQVEFRINNDTEQFLVIRLPSDARLWTASVAGEPVKPTETPAANDPLLVRIPLVKSAEGDPDYGVVLKYGGRLQRPGALQPIEFPVIHAVNINVELSQVRLLLPPTQQWFNFGGTMRRVADEGEYRARDLVHLTRQIRMVQQSLSSANPYTRLRASNNLKQLDSTVLSYQQNYRHYSANEFVEEQLNMNSGANDQAQAQRKLAESEDDKAAELDNRSRLDQLWKGQRLGRSKNVVSELRSNFAAVEQSGEKSQASQSRFNSKWLEEGRLQTATAQSERAGGEAKDRVLSVESNDPAERRTAGGRVEPSVDEGLNAKEDAKALVFQDFIPEKKPEDAPANLVDDQERYKRQLQQQGQAGQQGPGAPQSVLEQQVMNDPFRMDDGRGGLAAGFGSGSDRGAAQPASGAPAFRGGLPSPPGATDSIVSRGDYQAGLASLDVDLSLTSNGREYYFIAPRGEVVITARSVDTAIYDRVVKLAGLIAVLLVCMAGLSRRSILRASRPWPLRRSARARLILSKHRNALDDSAGQLQLRRIMVT